MYDLGDTVPLAAPCRNSAGQAANADTVTLTVTKPDGTTDTPAPTNPPSTTGQYTHAYATAQAGRHTVRWTFAGTVPAQAYSDVFHVWPSAPAWIVGLAETKDALNIAQTNTAHDDELRRTIAGASAVVEDIVGVVAVRTVTETHSGGERALLLRHRPVIAVVSVTEDGTAVDTSDYTVTEAGVLTRASSYVPGWWAGGVDNIVVVTTVGRRIVADNILAGTRDLIRANFRPQLGGDYSPFDTAPAREPGQMRLGFFVPNTVMERLNPSALGPQVG